MNKFTHIEKIKFKDGTPSSTYLIDETSMDKDVDLQSDLWFNEYHEDELERGEKIPVHSLQEVLDFMDNQNYSYQEHFDGNVLSVGGEHDLKVYQDLSYEWKESE